MEVLRIAGQQRLEGETSLGGAKNAVLPIMAACLLIDGEIILHNVPALTDVLGMRRILELFHCSVSTDSDTLVISTKGICPGELPDELMKSMRASNLIWGPCLGRFGKADIPLPGGCPIGVRPMDIHIKGMKALGAMVEEHHGHIISDGRHMRGTEIYLDFPSVGATENLVMAAVKTPGVTVFRNVAKEPEVVDLCCFLKEAGAKINGIGTDTLRVEGVKSLHSLEYTVIPDRIVAGTILLAAAMTRGDVTITNVIPEHLEALLAKMAGRLDLWTLFTVPEADARMALAAAAGDDPAVQETLAAAIDPVHVIFFEDRLEVEFPAGSLEGLDTTYILVVDYAQLDGVLASSALPGGAERS